MKCNMYGKMRRVRNFLIRTSHLTCWLENGMVRLPDLHSALEPSWEGPYVASEILGPQLELEWREVELSKVI